MFPCQNCQKLKLTCERARLAWVNGPKRVRNRRGCASMSNMIESKKSAAKKSPVQRNHCSSAQAKAYSPVPPWPFQLDAVESVLFSHCLRRFCATTPAFSSSENPFIRVVLPTSAQSKAVFDSFLTLGCVQSCSNGSLQYKLAMLLRRHRALQGCRALIKELNATQNACTIYDIAYLQSRSGPATLHLLLTSVLLLLYEQQTGDLQRNGRVHLRFLSQVFSRDVLLQIVHKDYKSSTLPASIRDTIQFVVTLFLYQDFLLSTSLRSKPDSKLYLPSNFELTLAVSTEPKIYDHSKNYGSRFVFPGIMTRIAAGDTDLTDWDIASWDGNLGWLPSFALRPDYKQEVYLAVPVAVESMVMSLGFKNLGDIVQLHSWKEDWVASELYRVAGSIYRRASATRSHADVRNADTDAYAYCQYGNLPSWSIELLAALPVGSAFERVILWPLSVVSNTLFYSVYRAERGALLDRLESIYSQFNLEALRRQIDHLQSTWATADIYLHGHPVPL